MKKLIFICLLSVFCIGAIPSYAQKWKKELTKNLVVTKGNKMTMTEYSLCKLADGSKLQIKLYAEATTGAVSRDFFVQTSTALQFASLLGMFAETGIPDITDLAEPIGKVDVTLSYFMTGSGIQVAVKTAEGTNNSTLTWEEFFK